MSRLKTYEERRNAAVSIVLQILCSNLFYTNLKDDKAIHKLISLKLTEAGGRSSPEGKRLQQLIEKTEKEIGKSTPYHTYFSEGFLESLSSISTPDVALHLEKSCRYFPFWDDIDLQYCIDTILDDIDNPLWRRPPLEKALSWMKGKLETSNRSFISVTSQPTSLNKSSAKTPQADILRYFPAVAAIVGNAPTDDSALTDLALWLGHWYVRNEKFAHAPRYTLLGKMQDQYHAASDTSKFLKACQRLHEALTLCLTTESEARKLLGNWFSPESWQAIRTAMKWWTGWIKEQRQIKQPMRTPADTYLEALKRIPLAVEWVNNSPRYVVYPARLDSTSFNADVRALREGFENTIPTLSVAHTKHLWSQFGKLLEIDIEGFKRRREWFERQDYGLDFLPEDYPALRFEVADNPDGLQAGQWVGPSFWTDIIVLLQFKQTAAQSAFEMLNAILPIKDVQPVPRPPKFSPALDISAPIDPEEEWSHLLHKNVVFTLVQLDKLLASAGLLKDSISRTPMDELKGSVWVGVIEALKERRYLERGSNNAVLYRVLADRYGSDIIKYSTITRPYNKENKNSAPYYSRILALLPAP
ncbi:hypothetical protein [Hymenobacter sp. BT491]|uniref:hypothetical protein n=1 Tax=Hymenobacter sp. BT491 TaxID=2766779 RepID=UPI001653D786|nr:hypothetical protein [Hymenobacter sp. BT491]MBC6991948.1 hypothetical protein [Hymenobacter sp. BT491]